MCSQHLLFSLVDIWAYIVVAKARAIPEGATRINPFSDANLAVDGRSVLGNLHESTRRVCLWGRKHSFAHSTTTSGGDCCMCSVALATRRGARTPQSGGATALQLVLNGCAARAQMVPVTTHPSPPTHTEFG
jgi:hypothetical protein